MYLLIYIFNILNSVQNDECIDFITKYMKCIFQHFLLKKIFKIKYILLFLDLIKLKNILGFIELFIFYIHS